MAGCTGNEEPGRTETRETLKTTTTTEDTPQTTTENAETITETQTTPQEDVLLEDIRKTRENLTESDKQEHYQEEVIPQENNYSVEADLESIDTRRDQIIKVIEEVGEDYPNQKAAGTRAMMHALHNELDWMNWEDDNIVNIVTRYNSAPMQNLNANYKTEDGDRNLDAMFAHGEASGEDTFYKDVPDSEIMDGDTVNNLTTDVESIKGTIREADLNEDDWEMLRMTMQSIVPGIKGPSTHDERAQDRNIIFDEEAIQYLGENYGDSAESVNEVSEEALEIGMSTVPIRASGRYVGVTADEDGLEVDSIYSQEEGKEKMRQPVEL